MNLEMWHLVFDLLSSGFSAHFACYGVQEFPCLTKWWTYLPSIQMSLTFHAFHDTQHIIEYYDSSSSLHHLVDILLSSSFLLAFAGHFHVHLPQLEMFRGCK